jgi:ABC-2 type transport system permease protein
VIALVRSQLRERRRSPLFWGLPIGFWAAFVVAIYPSVEHALHGAISSYPEALKQAFGIGELSSVGDYLYAEMLSLIVPLAVGYLAARAVASALSGASESGWLDELLSAPVSRRTIAWSAFLAAAVELAIVLAIALLLTMAASALAGAHLRFSSALAGFANVWPLALLFAGLTIVATGFSLQTSVVTGSVAGILVFMYILDLLGRLDTSLDGLRYASVFRYYGNAIRDGIDPASFAGVTAVAVLFAGVGAWLFERRDLYK